MSQQNENYVPYGVLAAYAVNNQVEEAVDCLRRLTTEERATYFKKLAKDIHDYNLHVEDAFFKDLQQTCYFQRAGQDPVEQQLQCGDEEFEILIQLLLDYGLAQECLNIIDSQTCANVSSTKQDQISEKVKAEVDRQKKERVNHSANHS